MRQFARRLPVYSKSITVKNHRREQTYGAVSGALIMDLCDTLESCLADVNGQHDQITAHAARMTGKRLRYLLEPMQEQDTGVSAIIDQLKEIQDVLVELHDAQLFTGEIASAMQAATVQQAQCVSKRRTKISGTKTAIRTARRYDRQPGLFALQQRLLERTTRAFAAFETQWIRETIQQFLEKVRSVGRELTRRGMANREIERKYLLNGLPDAMKEIPALEIEQGWLPGQRLSERLRRVRAPTEEHYFRTIKTGAGLNRLQIEEEAARDIFDKLWPLTEGQRVYKRRYPVSESGLVWEIDQFQDRKLVLAEIELSTEDMEVKLPEWLTPYLVREVTGESEFMNVNLAQ